MSYELSLFSNNSQTDAVQTESILVSHVVRIANVVRKIRITIQWFWIMRVRINCQVVDIPNVVG